MISGDDIEAFAIEANDEVIDLSKKVLGELENSLWMRIFNAYGKVTHQTVRKFWSDLLE